MDISPTDPGEFHQPITIQQPSGSTNSVGEKTLTWSTFATPMAKVRQLSGREQFNALQVQALATHEVRMRYLAGVTEQMQILFGSSTLKIVNVNDLDNRHIEHVITCIELRPQT